MSLQQTTVIAIDARVIIVQQTNSGSDIKSCSVASLFLAPNNLGNHVKIKGRSTPPKELFITR